jgi:iron(III) transport system substrate-binding protein
MTVPSFVSRLLPAISLIAVFALADTGGAVARTVAEIADLTGPDRQKILEEGARKEGALLWIGGLNQKRARRPILKAFKKKYPFIDAKGVRTGSRKALQRVLAEHRAKTPRVDVINANVVVSLKKAGLVQAFRSPALDAYPKNEKDPNRIWATMRYSYHGVAAYNTDLVKAADAPKTFEDLLDPKWKGKMVWGDSAETGARYMITYLRRTWGEAKTLDFLKKLAKQKIVTRTSSIRNILDLVVAGEHHIMISPALHHVGGARKKGAPIEAAMVSPVLARNGYFMLMKSAPNPHAAMLLIDFILSEQAQKILKKARYFPAHPKVKPAKQMRPYQPRLKGLEQFTVDAEMMNANAKKSDEIYRKFFQ